MKTGHSQAKLKTRKTPVWKNITFFLLFQIIFAVLTMPLLVFYGPFENVKNTIVGASWTTLSHKYIAQIFLNDKAIKKIVGSSTIVDPTQNGEEVQKLNFGPNHSDRIEVYNINGLGFSGKLMIIYDPSRIVMGYSTQIPRSGETTSVIAKKNNAIAAINAGGFLDKGWAGTGGAPMGFIIHDGKVVYDQKENEKTHWDTVGFTNDGMLIVGKHSIEQLMKLGIKEAVTFGPPLIVNGKPTITNGDGGWGIAPRMAIGQKENGEVLMLAIDGRSLESLGASLKDVQDILLQYGAVNAVNLDGGSSTTMFFNGKIINKPSDGLGERAVPSIFMVAPEKAGEPK